MLKARPATWRVRFTLTFTSRPPQTGHFFKDVFVGTRAFAPSPLPDQLDHVSALHSCKYDSN
jgi:hypothetical protein